MLEVTGSIVVVEDEPLISILIEDMASELGWQVEGTAHTEAAALEIVRTLKPTVAVLDIKLGEQTSLRVAAVCRERGIPIVFTTGYTAGNIPPECGNAPILPKPFSAEELAVALKRGLMLFEIERPRQASV